MRRWGTIRLIRSFAVFSIFFIELSEARLAFPLPFFLLFGSLQ